MRRGAMEGVSKWRCRDGVSPGMLADKLLIEKGLVVMEMVQDGDGDGDGDGE